MRAKIIIVLFLISLICLLIPFFFWFSSNFAKTKGRWNWKYSRRIKRSFIVCIPLSVLFIIIGILVGNVF